jgi:hypothetical protein
MRYLSSGMNAVLKQIRPTFLLPMKPSLLRSNITSPVKYTEFLSLMRVYFVFSNLIFSIWFIEDFDVTISLFVRISFSLT